MRLSIFLLLLFPACSWALICKQLSGRMKQIDASNGQVYAVDFRGNVFTRRGEFWARIPGNLHHVTVGASGVWGVGRDGVLYRLVSGFWAILAGQLTQVDAGGDQILVGVDRRRFVFCANRRAAVSAANSNSPTYHTIPGRMKYYSCGPRACWGVNTGGNIYCRVHIKRSICRGTHWVRVPGRLSMVEVGTDGTVYGISHSGQVYRRIGVTRNRPQGRRWVRMHFLQRRFRHVSADLGILWLVERNGNVIQCQ
ncbi:fish-egg lectin-like [Stegostoma tigrinum]|uniref:fish-egg lectin-like n=1 Tax=Stegostoma tigrinum TaxID=3053191 RepID=UPI002870465F|nr:fish-egg lectin-like [Stegostoma tigrinum]